jgi:integrase/recombinase XerD
MTGWRRVREVMAQAGIRGPHASPKGLRHGFGVAAVTSGVPLNLVQKWLGHAQLSTTAIYADAVGDEEHAIADAMWRNQEQRDSGNAQPHAAESTYRQTKFR